MIYNLSALRALGQKLGLDLSVAEKDQAEGLKVLSGLFPNQEGLLRHVSLSFLFVVTDPDHTLELLTNLTDVKINLNTNSESDILLITATLHDWARNIMQSKKLRSVLRVLNNVHTTLEGSGFKYLFKDYIKEKASWPDVYTLVHK
jgi:hypothetical protein